MRTISVFPLLCVIMLVISLPLTVLAGETLDRSLGVSDPGDTTATRWYDIRHLDVEGKGWTDTKAFYDRLPEKAEAIVRQPVWNLSRDSAGMCVRFLTDATSIRARWDLLSESLDMPHMPATGVSGLDLYVKTESGRWRWIANGRPTHQKGNTAHFVSGIPEETREYMMYLPLYNGVTSVEVGIPEEAGIAKADPRGTGLRKPMLFYGTSITQGGCASRTGMVHTAILGRWLNYPVINLGFSGNGRMESEMADLFAELDPSVYVLDCLPNINGEQVTERTEPFVYTLRKAHPETPIVLIEDRSYTGSFFVQGRRNSNIERRAALRQAYFRLKDAGVINLYYVPGDNLVGYDDEGTVDSSHPTDLGFMRQAEVLYEVLEPILNLGEKTGLMKEEWRRSNPDIVVYLPKGTGDGDNEHFQVFEAPKSDELLALWTQSSVEGRGNNRAVLSRSLDGELWSEPIVLAGKTPGGKERQASWAFPIVAKTGRIYCFYTKELAAVDERQSSGSMGCLFSDDNGYTWTAGEDITVPKNKYDNPDPSTPPNWIVWQKPIRDGRGHWIAGYTQSSSTKSVATPTKNWPDRDSRCAFVRFDNIDDGPDPGDLKLTWYPENSEGLEVPHRMYPRISVCQEPALILLPDGRLFTIMRTMTGYIWYSVSEDGGATWQKPEELRYRDGGEKVPNPIAPSPLYQLSDGRYLLVFNNNNGQKGKYDQFREKWDVNQLNFLRNPAFISVGEFRPGARQPVWFSQPKQILDTDGVAFGPKVTASIAMYPSLTECHGKRVLWYPDRKHFLLGKYIGDDLLAEMTVPEK